MYIIVDSEMSLQFKFIRWTFFRIPTNDFILDMIFERGVRDWSGDVDLWYSSLFVVVFKV